VYVGNPILSVLSVLPLSVRPSVQDIFRCIFLSSCWWQKSDIWSQASYTCRYTILWVAFLDPSDSYFLLVDLVGFYTHWTYMHIFHHLLDPSDSCLPTWFLYTLNIYAHFSSHFSRQLLMAEIWYLVTGFI
jgi:hypothetical protein